MCGLGGGPEEVGRIVRHHNLSALIALLRRGSVRILHGNCRALRSSEADGDETDALVAGVLCLGDDVVDILECLAVAHDDERLVGA